MQLRVGAARQGRLDSTAGLMNRPAKVRTDSGLRILRNRPDRGRHPAGASAWRRWSVAAKLASRASLPSLLLPAANLSSLLCGTARHRGRALAGDNARSL